MESLAFDPIIELKLVPVLIYFLLKNFSVTLMGHSRKRVILFKNSNIFRLWRRREGGEGYLVYNIIVNIYVFAILLSYDKFLQILYTERKLIISREN